MNEKYLTTTTLFSQLCTLFPFNLHTQPGSTALDRITHTPRCLAEQFASTTFISSAAQLELELSAISPKISNFENASQKFHPLISASASASA